MMIISWVLSRPGAFLVDYAVHVVTFLLVWLKSAEPTTHSIMVNVVAMFLAADKYNSLKEQKILSSTNWPNKR